jgi:hypothetical protein
MCWTGMQCGAWHQSFMASGDMFRCGVNHALHHIYEIMNRYKCSGVQYMSVPAVRCLIFLSSSDTSVTDSCPRGGLRKCMPPCFRFLLLGDVIC